MSDLIDKIEKMLLIDEDKKALSMYPLQITSLKRILNCFL